MRQPSPTTRKISTSFAKSFAKPVNAVSKCCLHRLKNPGSLSNPTPPMMASQLSDRSEEHTSELQSLMRISYAVFCLKKKMNHKNKQHKNTNTLTQLIHTSQNDI